jgi:Helix-turn-helix domain
VLHPLGNSAQGGLRPNSALESNQNMPIRLSTRQASEYLDLPESTLRYYRHVGKGPASYVLGRRVFYDVCDLDTWKDAQKAATLRGGVE